MTPLEVRIIAYSIAAILFATGNIWIGYHFTAQHYEAIAARDALARDQAIQTQQEKAIAALTAQQAATAAAEKQYADLKTTADDLSQRLADSVSGYASLRRGILSATATAAGAVDAAAEGARRDQELAGLVRQATEACLGDAAQLNAFQTWASAK